MVAFLGSVVVLIGFVLGAGFIGICAIRGIFAFVSDR